MNYTKLLKKLSPERDGEPPAHLRTGVIDTVNSDGTVDVVMSGVTLTSVPKLESAIVSAGDNVQMISFRGSLLVLGRVSSDNPSRVVGSVSITPTANTPSSQTMTYPSLGGSGTITAQTTANTAFPGSVVLETSVSTVGATSTIVWIYRTNTTTTTVYCTVERAT